LEVGRVQRVAIERWERGREGREARGQSLKSSHVWRLLRGGLVLQWPNVESLGTVMIDDRGAHHLVQPAYQVAGRAPFANRAHRLAEDVVQQVFGKLWLADLSPDRRQQTTAEMTVGRRQRLLSGSLLVSAQLALDRHAQQRTAVRESSDV
jgi:hypothetical protein